MYPPGYQLREAHPSGLNFLNPIDNKFRRVREDALTYWLQESKRKRDKNSLDDDFSVSVFCDLQNRVSTKYGDTAHLALFCNLGDWGSHISDILLDTSNDEVNLTTGETARKLFRYYTRLMHIVSELVADVAQVSKELEGTTKGNRQGIKNGDKLIAFVNHYVKHKKNNSHCDDHHLPVAFEDTYNAAKKDSDITFGSLKPSKAERFFIPSLKSIVDIALASEQKLKEVLASDESFEKIFDCYKGVDQLPQ